MKEKNLATERGKRASEVYKKTQQSKYQTPEQKVQKITKKIFDEQEKVISNCQKTIVQLTEQVIDLTQHIEHLERKFILNSGTGEFDLFEDLKGIDTPKEKVKLEDGVEYISKIISGEFRKEFYWDERKEWMNTYVIELEGVEGLFQLNVFTTSKQPEINDYIKHTVRGRDIKQYKFL